jgi:hypothetical protein
LVKSPAVRLLKRKDRDQKLPTRITEYSQCWWLLPVILAIWEAEIGRIAI